LFLLLLQDKSCSYLFQYIKIWCLTNLLLEIKQSPRELWRYEHLKKLSPQSINMSVHFLFVCRSRLGLCLESEGQSISRLLGLCEAEQAVYRWRSDNQVQDNGPRKKKHLCITGCVSAGYAEMIWRNCSRAYGKRNQTPMACGSSEEGTGANARYRNDARHSRPNETQNADSGDL
jgi:hypothetical protein